MRVALAACLLAVMLSTAGEVEARRNQRGPVCAVFAEHAPRQPRRLLPRGACADPVIQIR